ncbi:MAG: ArsR/SmtB family transcription factor [Candidatus Hadarchaeum sp.]|uniref:ArsR/SmtB family transcription factor n=1 Tax=Candidatus Hadarchaeum sp. TaxID=2883567 RepID=UPI003D13A7BC
MGKKQFLRLRSKVPPDYIISDDVLRRVEEEMQTNTKDTLRFLQAMSHPTRLRILRALRVKELCVCVFVALMKIKYSKLSYHLRLLKEAGLVDFKKDKNFLIYRLTDLGRKVLDDVEG